MILFSDFDNTLYDDAGDSKVLETNLLAVRKFRERGHLFCINTGRCLSSLAGAFPEYADFVDFLILDNGATCLNKNGTVIFERSFSSPVSATVLKKVETIFHEKLQQEPDFLPVYYYNSEANFAPSEKINKLRIWVKGIEAAQAISDAVNQEFAGVLEAFPIFYRVSVNSVIAERGFNAFVDIMPFEAGKEKAVAALCKKLKETEIFVVGDGLNDLPMVKDFDGFIIEDSELSKLPEAAAFRRVPSVAKLIKKLLEVSQRAFYPASER